MDRKEIFLKAAEKLRSDFDELSVIDHDATRGSQAEVLVRDFLNQHLPKRYSAGGGFIVDHRGGASRQVDVLVYDALNCPVYRASEDAGVYPNDNVAAVIEVKSTLDKAELKDAWDKVKAAKALHKTPAPDSDAHVITQTLGVVFAYKSATSLDTLSKNYEELFRKEGRLGTHVDLVVVLDEGLLTLVCRMPNVDGWMPSIIEGRAMVGEGVHIAVSAGSFGRHTLDVFFRILLGHLTFFRHRVDHPGFDFGELAQGDQRLRYLTSVTLETDPSARRERLERYKEEVWREFEDQRD